MALRSGSELKEVNIMCLKRASMLSEDYLFIYLLICVIHFSADSYLNPDYKT